LSAPPPFAGSALSALPKHRATFELSADSCAMRLEIAERYGLSDPSKALRCRLDCAATDRDGGEIVERVRCRGNSRGSGARVC
jgi:hypothetical protein